MPVLADFPLSKYQDGLLTIAMDPPVAIGGWNVNFTVLKRFGGASGIIVKNMSSGYIATSGITIINSGQGIMQITINSVDTSGMEYGAYAGVVERMDSGFRTPLSEGDLILYP